MTMRCWLTLMWMGLACLASPAFGADEDPVLVASSGRHVFVVRADNESQGWSISHLDTELGPGVIRTIHRLQSRPEAIAASGNRCWVVLPPRDAQRISRVVISLAVEQHPINGVWFANPPGAPRVLPPVPRDGIVGGLVATPSELLLVFIPSQRQLRGIDRPDRPEGEVVEEEPATPGESPEATSDLFPEFDPELGGFLQLALPGGMAWEQVVGPDAWETATGIQAGLVDRPSGLRPAVFWSEVDREGWVLSVFESGGGCPIGRDVHGLVGTPLSLVAMTGRTALASHGRDGGLAIGDLLVDRDGQGAAELRPFATLAEGEPSAEVGVVFTPAGPWVVGVSGGTVVTTTLDRSTGKPVIVAMVAEEATAEGTLVPYEIALFVVVASFLGVLMLRPALAGAPSVVVPGLRGLGFARRAAGLCIDLAPGAMAVVVIFNLDPLSYVEELRAGDPGAIPPLLALMGISGGVAAILEVLTGRSLGKWLVGGRILRLDGSPATVLQRGLRSLLRLSILLLLPLAWPLALLPLLDPVGRGIPELLTRTVVSSGDGQALPPDSE